MISQFSLFKRISTYALISIATSSISFFFLPLVTKYLSAEDYGILSVFNAIVRFFAAIIPLGMGHLLMVYIFQKKEEFPRYFSSFIKATVVFSIILSLILGVIVCFKSSFFGLSIPVIISLPFIAFVLLYYELMGSYFIYTKQLKWFAFNSLFYFFLELLLIILLVVVFPYNWEGRVGAMVISLFALFFVNTWYCIKKKILISESSIIYTKELVFKGFPLLFMSLSIMIMNLSDRFFIEHFWGLGETGYYGIASTVSGILLVAIGALINTIRPQLFEILSSDKRGIQINKLTLLFFAGLIVVTIGLYFCTPLIFSIMINEKFAQAEYLVAPLVGGLFFWGVYNYFLSFLMYKKSNKLIGLISLFGIIVNIVTNYFLIKYYNAMGAAYATLLTYICIASVVFVIHMRNQKKEKNVV
jgi:O-antigen/teichoic acid export membrane protein